MIGHFAFPSLILSYTLNYTLQYSSGSQLTLCCERGNRFKILLLIFVLGQDGLKALLTTSTTTALSHNAGKSRKKIQKVNEHSFLLTEYCCRSAIVRSMVVVLIAFVLGVLMVFRLFAFCFLFTYFVCLTFSREFCFEFVFGFDFVLILSVRKIVCLSGKRHFEDFSCTRTWNSEWITIASHRLSLTVITFKFFLFDSSLIPFHLTSKYACVWKCVIDICMSIGVKVDIFINWRTFRLT